MATHKDDEHNGMPRATLDDLYSQNENIIGLLERLNQNVYYLREAVYGSTQSESPSDAVYENPKHGKFGVVAESSDQVQSHLAYIADEVARLSEKISKK